MYAPWVGMAHSIILHCQDGISPWQVQSCRKSGLPSPVSALALHRLSAEGAFQEWVGGLGARLPLQWGKL